MNVYKVSTAFSLALCCLLCTCKYSMHSKLSAANTQYIKNLGLLSSDENILYFDSQGGWKGIKQSGNFISDKRIASYWIDKNRAEKSSVLFAYYQDIDSIKTLPRITSLTYVSSIKIYPKNGKAFEVYVEEDSINTWKFFNAALAQWNSKK